jgi:anaerobic ribonucleoside-triphosphate reductase activating protein
MFIKSTSIFDPFPDYSIRGEDVNATCFFLWEEIMNYGQVYFTDTANGVGCRTALFVSGCSHHCEGCFNPETWNFDYGELFTEKVATEIVDSLKPAYINGLTILGGEPMEVRNQPEVWRLIERIRKEVPGKSIWIYSGYTWEELRDPQNKRTQTEFTSQILENIDVLVDGEFVLEKKNISLRFRGSENQRIIDVQESLKSGEVVLTEFMN